MLSKREIEAEGLVIASNIGKFDGKQSEDARRAVAASVGKLLIQLLTDIHRIADALETSAKVDLRRAVKDRVDL